ncbi:hypothetical protein PRK78_000965 [Emydomyces testavorans]|uniref:Survival Motor Neuron Gemin2-binding domain-containing protein n=1 Tax=Emydomyces testavorans TaxID=2070801 RepID=A0AAF0DCE2_9EURO|nr:hypothetical protein PRK78_000965 [Emydomyces testavorans]
MGKQKKAKGNRPLTQEEIWDDSALIASWEEAAEEYKLYHGIQAKGEVLEDALRDYEANEAAKAADENGEDDGDADAAAAQGADRNAYYPGPGAPSVGDDGKAMREADKTLESYLYAAQDPVSKRPRKDETQSGPSIAQPEANQASGAFSTLPHMILGTADTSNSQENEGLKNLMMSWYFAGYYTGLYEGQRRANA